eukprot:447828-Pyramimonas_sp.AAC.1
MLFGVEHSHRLERKPCEKQAAARRKPTLGYHFTDSSGLASDDCHPETTVYHSPSLAHGLAW